MSLDLSETSGLTGHFSVWNEQGVRVMFMLLTAAEAQAAISAVENHRRSAPGPTVDADEDRTPRQCTPI